MAGEESRVRRATTRTSRARSASRATAGGPASRACVCCSSLWRLERAVCGREKEGARGLARRGATTTARRPLSPLTVSSQTMASMLSRAPACTVSLFAASVAATAVVLSLAIVLALASRSRLRRRQAQQRTAFLKCHLGLSTDQATATRIVGVFHPYWSVHLQLSLSLLLPPPPRLTSLTLPRSRAAMPAAAASASCGPPSRACSASSPRPRPRSSSTRATSGPTTAPSPRPTSSPRSRCVPLLDAPVLLPGPTELTQARPLARRPASASPSRPTRSRSSRSRAAGSSRTRPTRA